VFDPASCYSVNSQQPHIQQCCRPSSYISLPSSLFSLSSFLHPFFCPHYIQLMFEASDPEVFSFYVKHYGPDINLFVDWSQVVQLECLRRGVWGTETLFGRVLTAGL